MGVQPLGRKLGLHINNDIKETDHKKAATAMFKKLSRGDDVVLAAWEHLNIKGVCEALGVDKHKCGKWPGDDYDSGMCSLMMAGGWMLNITIITMMTITHHLSKKST